MLLRVDKLSGTAEGPSSPPSDPPLHVCLSTAIVEGGGDAQQTQGGDGSQQQQQQQQQHGESGGSGGSSNNPPNNTTGEVLTIGRKNCTVTIDDRSMSRAHASIALLSNHPIDTNSIEEASSLLGEGRVMMEYGTPTTPEEIHACETSNTGVICVVRDKGSKFGTFISVDEMLLKEYSAPPSEDTKTAAANNGNGDETEDETDDEGATSSKQMNFVTLDDKQKRAVQLLSNNDANNGTTSTLPKFQQLEKNSSAPLLQLSHSKSGATTSSSSSAPYVIILCGPQGSAVRLSLLPLQFTFSKLKKPELDPLLASLHYIGATHSTQWDIHSSHLVAPEKAAAAKHIMAWACRKPVVLPGYIEALLQRTDATDELPKEEDFCPKGSWDEKLKWTPEPCTALKGYRIAVMIDDDNGPLSESAGADILHIHEDAPTSSQDAFETWWGTQMQKALEEKLALVVVASSSRKCKKISDWLKHNDNVRYTNPKNLAKAITNNEGEGEELLDMKKVPIAKIEGWDVPNVVEVVGGEKDDGDQKMPADSPSAMTMEKETVETRENQDETFEPPANDDYNEPEEEIPVSTRRKRRQEEEEEDDMAEKQVEEDEQQPARQKRRRKEAQPEEEDVEEEEEPGAKPTKQKKKVVYESDDEPGLPSERIALPMAGDGWLLAAGKKRKAYRKARPDDAEIAEDVPEVAAETEKVSLVVRKYVPPNKRGGRSVTGNGKKKKKKDFKRFRKNNVIRGYTTFNASGNRSSQPKIRLVEELAKETDRLRQLQQDQENLAREQELADELFNDSGVAKSGRKRGAGSMTQYLSQKSTTKRGRGRR